MREHIYTQIGVSHTIQELLSKKEEPKMERNLLKEAVNLPLRAAQHIIERLSGGGWSDLPFPEPKAPKVPVRANITYFPEPEAPLDEAA